jgi:hypothetical protein
VALAFSGVLELEPPPVHSRFEVEEQLVSRPEARFGPVKSLPQPHEIAAQWTVARIRCAPRELEEILRSAVMDICV